MTSTVAIVWPCPLGVDEYEAAGRDVEVPRPDCPACDKPMIFWSWYSRTVRDGDDRRIWVRRSKCVPCRASHGLLPAFCLLRRLYCAEVIGPAVAAIVDGALTRKVAEAAGFPYTTVRDWRRRHRDRAPTLTAGFAALAVELGAVAPLLAGVAERAALEALYCAWATAWARFGGAVAGLWRIWSVVSGTGVDTPHARTRTTLLEHRRRVLVTIQTRLAGLTAHRLSPPRRRPRPIDRQLSRTTSRLRVIDVLSRLRVPSPTHGDLGCRVWGNTSRESSARSFIDEPSYGGFQLMLKVAVVGEPRGQLNLKVLARSMNAADIGFDDPFISL